MYCLSRYWERKEDWALYNRKGVLTRANNTNNYAEAAMRVLKDRVFERVKAFNLAQMVDFVITRLEGYYERKLLDAAHNRLTRKVNVQKAWLTPPDELISRIEVIRTHC
jgi:hypothetical protein